MVSSAAPSSSSVRLALVVLVACACSGRPLALPEVTRAMDLGRARDLAPDLAGACILPPEGNASVEGMTPNGPFHGRWALAWYDAGDCAEQPNVQIYDDMLGESYLLVQIPPMPALGSAVPVKVFVVRANQTEGFQASGSVTLTQAEPLASDASPALAGTLTVDDAEVVVSGSFAAPHCPTLDRYCV
jgi:hypothetical protein